MKRLICSLVTVASMSTPLSAFAQYYGGGYYPPTHNHHWQQHHFGGDTVIYNGLVLTNNLTPNKDTCDWVREAWRLPCEYFRNEPNSTGYHTHYVGRPLPRLNNQNTHQWQNPGRNNNSGWRNRRWNYGVCVYRSRDIFIKIHCR